MKAIENVKRFCRVYPQALMEALHEGILEIALEIQRTAVTKLKEHGAVDLGQLWNSIHVHRISATEVIVGTNVEYAAAVEFGTKGHWLTIQALAKQRGISIARTKSDFLEIIKVKGPRRIWISSRVGPVKPSQRAPYLPAKDEGRPGAASFSLSDGFME